jgi:NAD(P)-dependent dehydrogenase (short-subunit alcohol dehydrogenase family)
VTSKQDSERAVEAALNHGGRLDGLAAVAGRGRHGTASQLTPEEVADELTAKTTGLLHLVTAATRPLHETEGRVVALTAPTALEPEPAMAAISAGRAALDNLVRSLALELAPSGVRVNAVGVGLIDTPRQRRRFASNATPGTSYEQWLHDQALQRRIPMRRPGTAEEVATAIVWLLSPVTSYTTGAVLDVTGGLRSR